MAGHNGKGECVKKPKYVCKVLGCGADTRWRQHLCADHFAHLPQDLRSGLIGVSGSARLHASGNALYWYADPANLERVNAKISAAKSPPPQPYAED